MKQLISLILTLVIAFGLCACASDADSETTTAFTQGIASDEGSDSLLGESEIGAFRPVDCTIPALSVYDYPFLGLTVTLPQSLLDAINARDVFIWTFEDYLNDTAIDYALLRFSAPTQAQKEEEGMSVDILAWEEALAKIGAIGVYSKSSVSRLDDLTLCDNHQKLGESPDGAYEYYLSTLSTADGTFASELQKSAIEIYEMHTLDLSNGYSAFATDRIDGIANVGNFTTEDVFGNSYDQTVFSEYDLTLVNVFATWCTPCVQEMPELEKLRQTYADKGIRLGVLAIVLDAKTASGIDENARELAKVLHERSNANFPFLIADDGNLNGRLIGIESIPESFFVDSNGNIVSEPYVGARSEADWATIVDAEFSALAGNA